MSILLAAALAAASAAVLVALPSPARLRFGTLGHEQPRQRPGVLPWPSLALLAGLPVALLLGPVAGVLAAAAGVAGLRWHHAQRRRRVRAQERASVVEACTALSAELRAGRTPAEALEVAAAIAAGPARDAVAAAAAAARLGGDVPGALRSCPSSAVAAPLRALAACWAVCAHTGSGLAAAVDRLEEGLRAEQGQRRAVEAELAGPRASAGVLAVLPAAGLLMAAGLGADPLHVLLHTPLGLGCLSLGLLLDGLGVLWTSRLVARAAGPS